jgi:hypothetical protein
MKNWQLKGDLQVAQKDPEVRRAKNRRAAAYSSVRQSETIERNARLCENSKGSNFFIQVKLDRL